MNRIAKFFHEFFKPHCLHCIEDEEQHLVCDSCETVKAQLEIANFEKKQLLNALIEGLQYNQVREPDPVREISKEEPIRPKTHVAWSVRRQMLEAEDRKRAQLMKEAEKDLAHVKVQSVEALERELGIVENKDTK